MKLGWQSTKHSDPEKQVEQYLVDKITNLGGIPWKFTSPGTPGVPDRIVIMNGLICFIELKRPKGGRISDIQAWRINQLDKQGMKAYVLKNKEQVDYLVEQMMKGILPENEEDE